MLLHCAEERPFSGEEQRMEDWNRLQTALDRAMAEKYYHSMGAALYEEGRFDEAIRFFEQALSLDEQPYIRCHLGLSFMAKDDLDRALKETTRAIQLCPAEADYYYRRSAVWRRSGEHARAIADIEEAVRLEPNYRRVEQIRAGAEILRKAACGGKAQVGSCIVPCPAYCCYFSHEPVVHGVCIGPWKLRAIRQFLLKLGLHEAEFLGRFFVGEEVQHARMIPPHFVVKEQGQKVVFFPKRRNKVLGRQLLHGLPRGREYKPLAWITPKARPCVFLDSGKCSIHDLGDEPALPACKEFFCLTGLVFLSLSRLGLIRKSEIRAKGMDELNRIAADTLVAVSDELHADESDTALRAKIYTIIRHI
jgi:tetratricopeptide (TPR) repeat protein